MCSRVFVGGLNKGRTQPGSLERLRCGFRSVCRDEQGVDPAVFSAGTEMWASGVFFGCLNKGRTQPGSVKGCGFGLRSICHKFQQVLDTA